MEQVPGGFGTSASLVLRLGQAIFSLAALLFMCLGVEFDNYSAFSYLVIVMGFITPWSVSLALIDAYSVYIKSLPRQRRVLCFVITGDWVLSFLSLAAACSTASVASLLFDISGTRCEANLCSKYQLSAAMAFLSWFLQFASTLFNLWLFPSL